MPLAGFEPTISVGERPQIYALDRAATGTGHDYNIIIEYYNTYHCVTVAYSIQYSNMLYRFVA